MNVKRDYLYELQIYKAQNPETGEFDVVFEIEGKKLYAHKSKLCEVSTTFDAMLSERWTTQNEPIQINSYSFDNFKQLITFIYSGDCKFTLDNIFTMVDIAEFYNVSAFKTACQDFLLKTARNLGDVYPLLELTYKYSMESLKKHLLDFISRNLLTFIKLNEFQALPRSIIFDVVQSNQDTVIQEELFEAIYEWAENQAIEKQNHDANLNLNDAIKKQLTEVLPLIKFQKMKNEFLIKFVVSKSLLFSGNDLSDILWNAHQRYTCVYSATFIDENGKKMQGVLKCSDNEKMFQIIQSKRNENGGSLFGCTWIIDENLKIPSGSLIKNSKIVWYLVSYVTWNQNTLLAVRHRNSVGRNDNLLAELVAEDGFQLTNCKIV